MSDKIIGTVLKAGDLLFLNGPGLIIETTREQLMEFEGNIAFAEVEIRLRKKHDMGRQEGI